ncbi:MAG: ATP-dependent RecD-like DNA helicase [Candidatus Latescibacteria bacterium]|nr:ATP-dependent RecD-like DNA helicase [Candidatus Latescibacterota bacterium]
MDTLIGTIERVTYQNEDTGYTVARLRPELRHCQTTERPPSTLADGLWVVVGNLAALVPGERVEVHGYWVTHSQYGKQFKIIEYKTLFPATVEGIRKYLGSGLIKGIGPVKAGLIVDRFGERTFEVIDAEPERLLEIKGIAQKTVNLIKKGWEDQKHIQEVMQFLLAHNVSTTYAVKIYKMYGNEAIQKVTENPYRLASDIWGIGFITADKIAQNLGVDPAAPSRIAAGIQYVLNQCADDGHVFVPQEMLAAESAKFLHVEASIIPPAVQTLVGTGEAIVDGDRVYLAPFYYAEVGIARHLARLLRSPRQAFVPDAVTRMIDRVQQTHGIQFNDQQRLAILTVFTDGILVLTGGPGTGKTTCVRGMLALFQQLSQRVVLAAPTGRAAKRLSEVTGAEAKTIHRLLEFNPGATQFKKGTEDPLDADAVILDEVSMVDTVLMNALLRAVPSSARLVMVGDADQLPSVGAGNVLRDVIASGAVPVVHLHEIFRQAQESDIVMNAHRVNQGEFPRLHNRKEGDFFFIGEDDPASAAETIQELCARRLPGRYGYDPIDDIQVLTPMYRGEIGVDQLNRVLQETLNPDGASLKRGDRELRVGDKVMQTRNNYDKMVFNGDIGRVTRIDLESQTVEVTFNEPVGYDFSELDEVVLAYAISVHKSQGSEYPAIVLPLFTSHYLMLQRNLLYTAITRAKSLVVLVGTKKAVAIAVKNNDVTARYTGLREGLQKVEEMDFGF